MVGIVYLTTNLINNKIYVGQHECSTDEFDGYLGSGKYLLRAIQKYGKQNFKRETLRICETYHEMDVWEHYFIKLKRSQNFNIGYNLANGDPSNSIHGLFKTPEFRTKMMGENNPAKRPDVRMRLSAIKKEALKNPKNNSFYGKHHTEESKRKMSEAHKFYSGEKSSFWGRHHTEETKKKISECNRKNRWINNGEQECQIKLDDVLPNGWNCGRLSMKKETREKLSKTNKGRRYVKKHKEESKRIMSQKAIGRKCINNGKVNNWLYLGQVMPEGFVYGMLKKSKKMI